MTGPRLRPAPADWNWSGRASGSASLSRSAARVAAAPGQSEGSRGPSPGRLADQSAGETQQLPIRRLAGTYVASCPPDGSSPRAMYPGPASVAREAAGGQVGRAAGPEVADRESGCLRTPVDQARPAKFPVRGRRCHRRRAGAGARAGASRCITPGSYTSLAPGRRRRANARRVGAILANPRCPVQRDPVSEPMTFSASLSKADGAATERAPIAVTPRPGHPLALRHIATAGVGAGATAVAGEGAVGRGRVRLLPVRPVSGDPSDRACPGAIRSAGVPG